MSIEQALAALTAAVEANTAALQGAKPAAAPAPAPAAKAEKPAKAEAAKPAEPEKPKAYVGKHTYEETQVAVTEVKTKLGTPVARAVMIGAGYEGKLADLSDPKLIDAIYEAAQQKLAAEDDGM